MYSCQRPSTRDLKSYIHQEHRHQTGHIAHHPAQSLIFPLPTPGSVLKRAPLTWDTAQPYKGIGSRAVEADVKQVAYKLTELPVSTG